MASGLVRRANRPNTWLHRPACRREENPCQLGAALLEVKRTLGSRRGHVDRALMTPFGHAAFCCGARPHLLYLPRDLWPYHLVGAAKQRDRFRRATNPATSPNLRRHDQTRTATVLQSAADNSAPCFAIASSALHSMHPIGVCQHVHSHQSKYNEHNHSGHNPHHTHFGFFVVSFILVRHLFLLNLSSTVTPQHDIARI